MGTNYYWYPRKPCECCQRPYNDEQIHIGKSSMGWTFALHVQTDVESEDKGIRGLPDWQAKWSEPDSYIADEYGRTVSVDEMLITIVKRSRVGKEPPSQQMLNENSAIIGPNNLLRRQLKYGCIGYGDGTYDLCTGEFS